MKLPLLPGKTPSIFAQKWRFALLRPFLIHNCGKPFRIQGFKSFLGLQNFEQEPQIFAFGGPQLVHIAKWSGVCTEACKIENRVGLRTLRGCQECE